jgi:hypothetical protein
MGYLKFLSIISLLIHMSSCVPVPNQNNIRAQNLSLGNAPVSVATNFSPTKSSPEGGGTLTIVGVNLDIVTRVSIGGKDCSNIQFISDTQITCTLPDLAENDYPINLENKFAKVSSSSTKISYLFSPFITSIEPVGGPLAGGNTITIRGGGFQLGVEATIGGTPCSNTLFISSQRLTCRPPAASAGAADVVVTNTNSETVTLTNGYTYADAPTFTSVTSSTGKTAGGETVTIVGNNFQNGLSVTIGGNDCTNIIPTLPTSLTCTTPAGTKGAQDIIITNIDTQTVTASSAFTYIAPPSITGLDFSSGSSSGGEMITVNGSDFDNGATVDIGGSACVVTYRAPTGDLINCTTPAKTNGTYDVTVINSFDSQQATLIAGFTYTSNSTVDRSPTISLITPDGGAVAGGTAVTLTGSGFYDGAVVTIGGNPCTSLVVVNDTSITCNSPSGTLGNIEDVVVTNLNTLDGSLTSSFQYRNPPTLSSFSPTQIPLNGGVVITLTGTDFLIGPSITIDGVNCNNINYVNSTQLTCSPGAASAGLKSVRVTNYDAQFSELSNSLEYLGPPTISNISPTTSPVAGGGLLTITGTNFRTTPTVNVDGNLCTSPVLFGNTTVTCTIPAGAGPGAVDVEVINGSDDAQSATLPLSFTYEGPPVVSSITPTAGALAGGTNVTITGLGFTAGAFVTIGGSTCSSVNVIDATSLSCTTGANGAGTYEYRGYKSRYSTGNSRECLYLSSSSKPRKYRRF